MSSPDAPVDPLAALRHVVWSHLAAVFAVTDHDGVRRYYSSDVPESMTSRELAEVIARSLIAPDLFPALTAAWAQHFDDTAEYAGGFTEPERNGLRAAARMMRDVDVRARVHSTIGGEP